LVKDESIGGEDDDDAAAAAEEEDDEEEDEDGAGGAMANTGRDIVGGPDCARFNAPPSDSAESAERFWPCEVRLTTDAVGPLVTSLNGTRWRGATTELAW
jgi:hypothetical protein